MLNDFDINNIRDMDNARDCILMFFNLVETLKQENLKLKNLQLPETNWKDKILQSRYGFELWKYLLFAALLLFILEMLIIKHEERKKS